MNDRELEDALSGIHVARTQLAEPDELYGRVATIPEAGPRRRIRWPGGAPLGWLTSATRLTVVLVFVLIAGAVLIVGQPGNDGAVVAPGGSPSSTASDPLAGYDIEEVEPGVYRVWHDGVRDLDLRWSNDARLLAASDGSVWLLRDGDGLRLGDPQWHPGVPDPEVANVTDVILGSDEDLHVLATRGNEDWRGRADEPADIDPADQGADGTVWARLDAAGMNDPIARLDEQGWRLFSVADGIPAMNTLRPWGHVAITVGNDGSVWTSPTDEGGLGHFDGETWTHLLHGQLVKDLDTAPDGTVWILTDDGTADSRLNIYAIPDGQAVKEESMQISALRSATHGGRNGRTPAHIGRHSLTDGRTGRCRQHAADDTVHCFAVVCRCG